MNRKPRFYSRFKQIAAAAACIPLLCMGTLYAADEPSELNADTVEYDMKTGQIIATGNVLLKHGTAKATGAKGMYNVNTQAARLEGNVIAVKETARVTCDWAENDGKGHMQAHGNVHATKEDKSFVGDHIDYYPNDRGHIVIPAGGVVSSKDGTATADMMEGWLDEEHYVGIGNAHLISPPKNLEAGGDHLDYYGKDERKAILTGNAWAYQDNHSLRGNRLTVYLAEDGQTKVE